MHLITSHNKLEMVEEQSGIFSQSNSLHTESLFESSYGSNIVTHKSHKNKFKPYEEKMAYVGKTLKSVQKEQQKHHQLQRSQSSMSQQSGLSREELSQRNLQSAQQHED